MTRNHFFGGMEVLAFAALVLPALAAPPRGPSVLGRAVATLGQPARVLVWTHPRSGSTFLGEALSMHPDAFYLYEPCRAFEYEFSDVSSEACARLVTRLLSCSFLQEDINTLYGDVKAIFKSRVLRQPEFLGNRTSAEWKGEGGGKELYAPPAGRWEALKQVCLSSKARVVKEIRLAQNLVGKDGTRSIAAAFQILVKSGVQIVHLVRDPRAVLSSKMRLEAFCKGHGDRKQCIQQTCDDHRVVLFTARQSLPDPPGVFRIKLHMLVPATPAPPGRRRLARLQRVRPYLRLRYEDLASQPTAVLEALYNWLGLGALQAQQREWIHAHTEASHPDGDFKVVRNSTLAAQRWKSMLSGQVHDSIVRECGDVLLELDFMTREELQTYLPPWQTAPGTSIDGRVLGTSAKGSVVPGDGAALYMPPDRPPALPAAQADMEPGFSAWCGDVSTPTEGLLATGGHSLACPEDARDLALKVRQLTRQLPLTATARTGQHLRKVPSHAESRHNLNYHQILRSMAYTRWQSTTLEESGSEVRLSDCLAALKHQDAQSSGRAALCSAMTFLPAAAGEDPDPVGTCRLHNRSAEDFRLARTSATPPPLVSLIMLAKNDSCLFYDSSLYHTSLFYLGRKFQIPPPEPVKRFYMYEDPVFDYQPLVHCWRMFYELYPWEELSRAEMTQNTGALWLHETLKTHPLRTLDPEEAQLFIIPFDTFLSWTLDGECHSHTRRAEQVKRFLENSEYFQRHGGHDHLLISPWWGTARALQGPGGPSTSKWWTHSSPRLSRNGPDTLWSLLRRNAMLATVDEFFARDWNKVLVVPYVAHQLLTQSQEAAEAAAKNKTARGIKFYFRGGVSHGTSCIMSPSPPHTSRCFARIFQMHSHLPHLACSR
uniref:Protein-tyrosine sulfotransferase n=1 Tax=Rhizochromulina marina TaxID=1034831 RepID=A0A7S2SDK7_9STRA